MKLFLQYGISSSDVTYYWKFHILWYKNYNVLVGLIFYAVTIWQGTKKAFGPSNLDPTF